MACRFHATPNLTSTIQISLALIGLNVPLAPVGTLKLDSLLCRDSLVGIGVFDFLHFGYEIGNLNKLWLSVPASENYVQHFRVVLEHFDHLVYIDPAIRNRLGNLIGETPVVSARVDFLLCDLPPVLRYRLVL